MPNWNPDDGSALTNPPVNVTSVERSSLKLWHEFIAGWFDGENHKLRGVPVKMPIADVSFQDMELPTGDKQAVDGCNIHIACDMGTVNKRIDTFGRYMLYQDATVDFYVAAFVKKKRTDGHTSISLCQWAADTLYAILTSNILVTELTRRGMSILRPRPHRILDAGGAVSMRQLSLSVRYTYPLDEIIGVGNAPPANSLSYVYFGSNVRVGPNGYERKVDGVWYSVNVVLVDSTDGTKVPVVDTHEQQDAVPAGAVPPPVTATVIYFGDSIRLTANGYEQKVEGKWYSVDVTMLDSTEGGQVPVVDTTEQQA